MKVKKFYNLFSLQKRLLSIVLGLIVLFVAFVSRLFYLQVVAGKSLQIKASSQWLRDLPLSSKRGEIFDSNGVVLATTITTYDVYVRARNVENYKDYLSDKRWNRRSDVLNLGRNNLPTASSYAQHASNALGDVSNAVIGIGSGLSGLVGYLFNRNETVYPAQFSMASHYGNNAILAGGGF